MLSLYKFFTGKGQMVGFLLGVGLVLITILTAVTGMRSAGYSTGEDFNRILKSESNTETFDFFNLVTLIPTALVLLIIGVIIVFGVIQLVSNPKGSIKILGGLAALLIIAFVFYSMAEPETTGKIGMLHEKFDVSDTASRWISGGIKSVGVLFGASLLLMFVFEIRNLFK